MSRFPGALPVTPAPLAETFFALASLQGFNLARVKKGRVTINMWDLAGQPRFRSMWERYCRSVNAIIFVSDAADGASHGAAKAELFDLLSRPSLAGVPVLVLGNKSDLPGALPAEPLSVALGLTEAQRSWGGREMACLSTSCKSRVNIDIVVRWLTAHAPK